MAKTHEQFCDELKQISPSIEVTGHYTRAIDRVEVQCKDCGLVWMPKAYSLTQGKGCPHCSAITGSMRHTGKTSTKKHEDFCRELRIINPEISVLDKYISNKNSIRCQCSRCGHIWWVRPYSLLQGHGCPRCAKSGTSFMEQYILVCFRKALGDENVDSRNREVIGRELDIFIPKLKVAIEPGNWYLHQKNLGRDRKKRDLCNDQGIRLITVYDNYPHKDAPFPDDCYVFSGDYNKEDHVHIRQLVIELFRKCGIRGHFQKETWDEIEHYAYAHSLSTTHEDFVNKLGKIRPDIEVIGRYVNVNRRLIVKCRRCGYEWNAVPANLLSGDGCKRCGIEKAHAGMVKAQEEFEAEINRINPDIQIIGSYTGRHKPVKARCRICGFEWEPQAGSLLRGSSHKGAIGMHRKMGKH